MDPKKLFIFFVVRPEGSALGVQIFHHFDVLQYDEILKNLRASNMKLFSIPSDTFDLRKKSIV